MDGSTVDHSDSDSGESWTLLDNQPAYGDDAPDFHENSLSFGRDRIETHLEKDEDTDGISIISDSDPESSPCDLTCDKCSTSDNHQSQSQDIPSLLNSPQPPNNKTIESLCSEDDFLREGSHKLKTYVHRRNKRLSMVLNIIMLGSVITAAGVAIGHMWGAKNECMGPTPSVNKILSNLYKLQEENAYLRKKLNEMTAVADSIQQIHPSKVNKENESVRQQRCKKVFEGPLTNKVEKAFKCVDPDYNESGKLLDNSKLLDHEKEFLHDIGKLKKVYNQNKSWLDDQIHTRLNQENKLRNKRNIKDSVEEKNQNLNQDFISVKDIPKTKHKTEEDFKHHVLDIDLRIPESGKTKSHKAWNLRKQAATNRADNINKEHDKKITESKKSHKAINLERQTKPENFEGSSQSFEASQIKENKISYADSLKTDSDGQKVHAQINKSNELPIRGLRGYGYNRKLGDVDLLSNLISSSEEDIKKDDRYTGPKMKRDKKKQDRQKIHKKQKRKNKYEQWEMKGGYMNDFDEFSMTSSQVILGNDFIITPERKYFNNDFENYLNKLKDVEEINPKKEDNAREKKGEIVKKGKYKEQEWFDKRYALRAEARKKMEQELFGKTSPSEIGKKGKYKEQEWFDKRYALRAEARKKMEHELFGETSPSNAAWYFRRMNKRDQCRTQKDNSTFKKFSKPKMNYKMKH